MTDFRGRALSWSVAGECLELELHRPPCNEIGRVTVDELEAFAAALAPGATNARVVVVHSSLAAGFCAGADLRELHLGMQGLSSDERQAGVRSMLQRVHRVLATLDASPLPTIAAVHGVTFGGGLELALACDLIVADRMTRFAFPELRLGLIPGFGGIPRLRRDVGSAVARDLLLTGRSIGAARAHAVGLISQIAAEGEALTIARDVAGQIARLDPTAIATAKLLAKPIPESELSNEIDLFCALFARPAVEAALDRFVASDSVQPYLS